MRLQDAYPIVVTDKVAECRDYYTRWLGFQVAFEASWFVYLSSPGDRGYGLAFMAGDHPSSPPGPETFSGRGMFLTLQVADAAAEFESSSASEVWGCRSRTRSGTSPGGSGASVSPILPGCGSISWSTSNRCPGSGTRT